MAIKLALGDGLARRCGGVARAGRLGGGLP